MLHAWEVGSRYPRASDLLRLLEVAGKSPHAVLAAFAPCSGAAIPALVTSWLVALARDTPHVELGRRLGVNRNTVARWLSGATEPRAPELLAFVEATTQRALELISAMTDVSQLPSLATAHADLQQQRDLAYRAPWTHAVLRALELEQYRRAPRHQPGFAARHTGLSQEDEQAYLTALVAAKQVYRRNGRYVLRRVLSVDTREDPAANLALKRHWFQVTTDRLRQHGVLPEGLASYNLFAVSEADLARIRQAHLDYYERLRAIVAESREPTRVVLATIGLTPLASPEA